MSNERDIEHCASLLAKGGVVAIPTETVYGLAADASNAQAVSRVFAIKQRPANHPLIVHLGEANWLNDWACDIPESAHILIQAFWPGPLTLVLNRHPGILPIVTGGQDSVAVRMPDHALTLRLIRMLGRPVVAPSANRFTRLSPTSAADVREELGVAVDFILDGGACRHGLESTIIDLRAGTAKLLRPGAIPAEQIEDTLHEPLLRSEGGVRVPGQHPLHYSPNARVYLLSPEILFARAMSLSRDGLRVGVLLPPEMARPDLPATAAPIAVMAVPASLEDYASSLYRLLRSLDQQGCDIILATLPQADGLGAALRDRLLRAAGPRT